LGNKCFPIEKCRILLLPRKRLIPENKDCQETFSITGLQDQNEICVSGKLEPSQHCERMKGKQDDWIQTSGPLFQKSLMEWFASFWFINQTVTLL